MEITKIDDALLEGENRFHACLDDVPGLSAEQMKEFFDYIPRNVLIPKVNEMIDNVYTRNYVDNNYYTQRQTRNFIDGYVGEHLYLANQIDGFLAKKADADKVYTKDEVGGLLANTLKGKKHGEVFAINDLSPTVDMVTAKLSSKNILNYKSFQGFSGYSTVTEIENGIRISGNYYAFAPISLKKGESCVFSCKVGETTGTADYAGKWRVQYESGAQSELIAPCEPITLAEDAKLIFVYVNMTGETQGTADITDIMLEKGTSASDYTPFISDFTDSKIKVFGKNLADIEAMKDRNNWIRVTGGLFYYPVYVGKGNTVTVSVSSRLPDKYLYITIGNSEASKGQYGPLWMYNPSGSEAHNKISGTITSEDGYIYVNEPNCSLGEGSDLAAFLDNGFQIELGDTVTDYEPYAEPSEYAALADGTVENISIDKPCVTLMAEGGALADVGYEKDVNKALTKLEKAIIALGGEIS